MPTNSLVESAMGTELLHSERRRVTLLIALLAFMLVLVGVLRLAPQIAAPEIRESLRSLAFPLSLILSGFLVYEVLIRAWLGRLLGSNRLLPRGFQYLNVVIEISLPTVGLLIGGSILSPLSALASALPFLYFLFILLAALNLDFWLCVFAGSAACLQFLAASLFLLGRSTEPRDPSIPVLSMLTSPHQYLVKGVLLLAGGLIAGFVAAQIRRQMGRVVETLEERDRAVSIFGQHVSPQVADLLLKQPVDFSGQERNVCVMFLDIRDFTKLSSERTAPEVVEFLNVLFGPMIPIINSHSGIVNKFLGDGFMAVFGAPMDDRQQCVHAIEASLEILSQVSVLNQQGKIPHTRIGIGLHVGQAVTGNVGSSQRKEYTVIGDVVNLASRIEQANKLLASQLLVSEAVANTAGVQGKFVVEDMGLVELKGQPQPVRIYKLA
jgi:adenylate cyclase